MQPKSIFRISAAVSSVVLRDIIVQRYRKPLTDFLTSLLGSLLVYSAHRNITGNEQPSVKVVLCFFMAKSPDVDSR